MRTTWGSSRRETGIGSGRKLLLLALVTVTAISVDPGATLASASSSAGRFTGQVARVMTRNVYLGADLGPAIRAPDLNSFVEATGAVLRQTTATNFPTRANGLAAEILGTQPDLVGLQEVALWRTGPSSIAPLLGGAKTATTVRYDFLQLLLDQLNAGEEQYLPVVVEQEFDFEAPADENGLAGDGPVDHGRRACAGRPAVPSGQHAPGGLRPPGRPSEHPRPAGGRARCDRRAGDRRTACDPARRPQLGRRHGRPRRPAGLPGSPGRRTHRAQHG